MALTSPVFLSYLPRSGSTFLAGLLSGHPHLFVSYEADFPRGMLGCRGGAPSVADAGDLGLLLDLLGLLCKVSLNIRNLGFAGADPNEADRT